MKQPTTRIIRITECHQCPFRFRANYTPRGFVYKCELVTHTLPCPPICPPTGTPDWCPLEMLEEPTTLPKSRGL